MGRKTKYNHGKIKKAIINGIPLYHIRLFYLFNHTFNKHAYESSRHKTDNEVRTVIKFTYEVYTFYIFSFTILSLVSVLGKKKCFYFLHIIQ